MDETQKADAYLKYAQGDNLYINNGTYETAEVAVMRVNDGTVTGIDLDERPKGWEDAGKDEVNPPPAQPGQPAAPGQPQTQVKVEGSGLDSPVPIGGDPR
jgi:hypothetical protein